MPSLHRSLSVKDGRSDDPRRSRRSEKSEKKHGCLGYIGDIKLPFGWDGRSDDREIRRSEKSEKKALVV